MKKPSENYKRAVKCIDAYFKFVQDIGYKLTPIEKYLYANNPYVSGMVHMAMYFLNTNIDEYNQLKEYIWDKYGVNVGGTKVDLLETDNE